MRKPPKASSSVELAVRRASRSGNPGTACDLNIKEGASLFNGKIGKLTVSLEPPVLTDEYKKNLEKAYREAQACFQ